MVVPYSPRRIPLHAAWIIVIRSEHDTGSKHDMEPHCVDHLRYYYTSLEHDIATNLSQIRRNILTILKIATNLSSNLSQCTERKISR